MKMGIGPNCKLVSFLELENGHHKTGIRVRQFQLKNGHLNLGTEIL